MSTYVLSWFNSKNRQARKTHREYLKEGIYLKEMQSGSRRGKEFVNKVNNVPYMKFSTLKPLIRLNSLRLFVTRMRSWARVIEAIRRSMGPIGEPDFSKEALIFAYFRQHFPSNVRISKFPTNSSTMDQFFFRALLFSAPKNNSAAVIVLSLMSDGERVFILEMIFSEDRFRK